MSEREAYIFEKDEVQVIILYPTLFMSGEEAMQKAIEAIEEEKEK